MGKEDGLVSKSSQCWCSCHAFPAVTEQKQLVTSQVKSFGCQLGKVMVAAMDLKHSSTGFAPKVVMVSLSMDLVSWWLPGQVHDG
jgi:dTDP-4-dehydrorhamnose 3,5-epimerase-like enzyme